MLISLVGLPGSGKSTLGTGLAQSLGVDFFDCDAMIETRMRRSIRDIFETEGEAVFRQAETALLAELVERPAGVVATGGGIVLHGGNRELLRLRTFCIYLSPPIEVLARRLAKDVARPLLQVPDRRNRLRDLCQERDPLYRDTAAAVIDTGCEGLEESLQRLRTTISARAHTSLG